MERNWSNHLTNLANGIVKARILIPIKDSSQRKAMGEIKKQASKFHSPNIPASFSAPKLEKGNGFLFKPIKRVRLYEKAVEQIQNLILKKKYKPGTKLPSERDLARQFQISRPSLREALRILSVLGFIEIKVGDGIYVKKDNSLPAIESLNFSINAQLEKEEESFLKLWKARKILEMGIIDLAAQHVNDSFLKNLWQCIREMQKHVTHQDSFISAGIRFHRLIAEMAQNEILILIWDMLAGLMRQSQHKIYRISRAPKQALQAHKKIYFALRAKDSRKAIEAMKQHMLEEEEALLAALKNGRS